MGVKRGTCEGRLIPHRHAVDRSQLLSDGEDVQQGLGRVLPHAVASIDHGFTAVARGVLKCHRRGRVT